VDALFMGFYGGHLFSDRGIYFRCFMVYFSSFCALFAPMAHIVIALIPRGIKENAGRQYCTSGILPARG